jgi:hypothetical protein
MSDEPLTGRIGGRNHVISFVAPSALAAAIEVATARDMCSKSDIVRMSVAKELRAQGLLAAVHEAHGMSAAARLPLDGGDAYSAVPAPYAGNQIGTPSEAPDGQGQASRAPSVQGRG